MSDFFKTLKEPSEGIYKEKMSKFLSFAHPVNTAEEAKDIIKSEKIFRRPPCVLGIYDWHKPL